MGKDISAIKESSFASILKRVLSLLPMNLIFDFAQKITSIYELFCMRILPQDYLKLRHSIHAVT